MGLSAVSSCNTFASVSVIPRSRPIDIQRPNSYEEYEEEYGYGEYLFSINYSPKASESNPVEEGDLTQDTITNPKTLDNLSATLVLVALAVVVSILLVVLNSRNRSGMKPNYFGIFFGVLALVSSVTVIVSKESYATDSVVIDNKNLYDAIKACFELSNNEDENDNSYCSASDNDGNPVDVVFDDSSMSISRPDSIKTLNLDGWVTNIKLTDISELSKFPNLEYLDLANNEISDASVISKENFPNLESVRLFNNHIESFSDELLRLAEYRAALNQTYSYQFDEDGVIVLPPVLNQIIDYYKSCYVIYIYTYNIDINEMKVLDRNKNANVRIQRLSRFCEF